MMNADNDADFKKLATAALEMGFGSPHKRMNSDNLMDALAAKFGPFIRRRFHVTMLARCYGVGFLNRKWARYVKERGL